MELPRLPNSLALFTIFSLLQVTSALQVTPGSSCAALCLDTDLDPFDQASSTTNATDIVCKDSDYASTEEGIKFKQCLECMQKSQKKNETESDVNWLVYNLRYALGTCLYGFGDEDKVINSPCVINWACQPLKDAIVDGLDEESGENAWGYCDAANNALQSKNMESCVSCLKSSEEEVYLSNFLVTIQAGCAQKPEPGKLLGLSGSPFSRSALEITDAPTNITDTDPGASSSTITTGTLVGIAVGGGLFLIGGIALFVVYFRKKRAYKNQFGSGPHDDKDSNSRSSSRTMITHSQPWGHDHKKGGSISSRISNGGNSSDYYDKAEEEGRSRHFNYDPRGASGPGSAIPTHPAYVPRAVSRASTNTRGETPTPPPGAYRAGESYSLQRFRNAPEHPSGLSQVQTLSPAQNQVPQITITPQPVSTTRVPDGFVPPPPPPREPQPSVPAITVPSVPRVRVPKKYTPPSITVEPPPEDKRKPQYKKITQPLNLVNGGEGSRGERFADRPLQGGSVMATHAPNYSWGRKDFEKAINSGKSALYG